MTESDAIEELFGAVVTATDTEGVIHSFNFQLLPDKDVSTQLPIHSG